LYLFIDVRLKLYFQNQLLPIVGVFQQRKSKSYHWLFQLIGRRNRQSY